MRYDYHCISATFSCVACHPPRRGVQSFERQSCENLPTALYYTKNWCFSRVASQNTTPQSNNHLCLNAEVIIMKTLLKKSAILKTISSKISTYLHAIDADPQEDDSDFDDEEWMECPTKPTLAHIIIDLLLSPTYRLPRTVTAVRIYRDENIFSVCPCDVCIEREYQGYCHRCGQYLDWSKLEDAGEIFIGVEWF